MSLRNKILFTGITLYITIIIITLAIITSYSKKDFIKLRKEAINTLLENYTNDFVYIVTINNKSVLKNEIVYNLQKLNFIDFITVKTGEKIFFTNRKKGLTSDLIIRKKIKLPTGPSNITDKDKFPSTIYYNYNRQPLIIIIGANLNDFSRYIKKFKFFLGIVGIVSSLIFGILLSFFIKKFFAQVETISSGIASLSQGDFHRLEIETEQEFKPIINTFNNLVERLEKKDIEIKKYIASIEERNEILKNKIAEIKMLQETLIMKEKLAGLGTLSAGIAHEINNPVGAIRGLCELEQIKSNSPKHKKFFEKIISYCDRISEIVKKLKIYGKPSEIDGKKNPHKLSEIINDAIETSKLNKTLKDITIKGNYKKSQGIIFCRRNEILQVFLNLINNSIEALKGNGKIVIDIIEQNNYIEIHFKDNGPGIPEEIRNKIFDPFFTTKEDGGTGLGLYICHKIIENHNGEIKILDSQKGAHFCIVFSLEKENDRK